MNKIFKRYSLIGYEILKKKDLSILDDIKFFVEDQLLANNFFKDKYFYKTYFNLFLNLRFNKLFLFFYGISKGSFYVIPISPMFYDSIEKQFKIKISKNLSIIIYYTLLFERLIVFYLTWVKFIFFIISSKSFDDKSHKKIYLHSVPSETFKFSNKSNNYITFIANHFSNDKDRITFYHSNKSISDFTYDKYNFKYSSFPFRLTKLTSIQKFKIVFSSFYSILNIYFSKNILINLIDPKSYFILKHINNYYKSFDFIFFNNSDYLNRPIHSYGKNIEEKVYFLFYSLSCQMSYSLKNKIAFSPGWKLFDWPNYIVWNKDFNDLFREYIFDKNTKFKITRNNINLIDTGENIDLPKKSISIFNVYNRSLIKNYIYCRPKIYEKFTIENSILFISDIISYCIENKIHCFIKEKRKTNITSIKYLKYLENISTNKYIKIVDTNLSAEKMIKKSIISFSFPFTSTALLAKNLNKESFYYDPSNSVTDNHSCNLNINVIKNKKILYSTLDQFFQKK